VLNVLTTALRCEERLLWVFVLTPQTLERETAPDVRSVASISGCACLGWCDTCPALEPKRRSRDQRAGVAQAANCAAMRKPQAVYNCAQQRRRYGRPAGKLHSDGILAALFRHRPIHERRSREQIALTQGEAQSALPQAMGATCHTRSSPLHLWCVQARADRFWRLITIAHCTPGNTTPCFIETQVVALQT
jgi:hypothetical protein